MLIIQKVDKFLYNLFNIPIGEKDVLIAKITEYYSLDNNKPIVIEENGFIKVDIDINQIYLDTVKHQQMIKLCESGRFSEALPIINELIKSRKTDSDLYRIKGQVESEMGMVNEAMNSLIDALRWDPKNTYALIMMGNLLMKEFKDVTSAMTYYEQAHETDPQDHISLNNMAANLSSLGRTAEARSFFNKALAIDSSDPNTLYGLALLEFRENNFSESFQHVLDLLKISKRGDDFFKRALGLAVEISDNIEASGIAEKYLDEYVEKLQNFTRKKIEIKKDETIPTIAKVELAENHNRNYHLVKYQPNNPAVYHLVIHELEHIEMAEEARLTGHNMLFTATKEHRIKFFTAYEKYIYFLQKKGYPETNISAVMGSLFEGLNRQVFNTPIDLFIEDRIHSTFHSLQPVQFVSLYNMLQQGIDAVTRKEIIELTDEKILSKSKIYNLVNALHFKELFGLDFSNMMKPTTYEMNSAKNLYEEYLEYRIDPQPGEEYELIQNWANDLNLSKFFELVQEDSFRDAAIKFFDGVSDEEIDEDTDANKKIEMHQFLENHRDENLNPAVMIYMVGALDYFRDKDSFEIKKIAFQIAQIGMNGINPARKDGYHISLIPDSNFSGYQMLAYYYVSFALSAPQLLAELQLPFDKEYESAKAFTKQKK